ncbi:MAG TPA: DUF2191 domain-containing protein [Lentisphaeria bacterium]|nr:MAG: hypothetical protein A2X48_18495 [Lentisphaerae bacterium GWF2_49_21]HBC87106.1 DUF2191 domain-containing protein [Lentisphaeria bacterium]
MRTTITIEDDVIQKARRISAKLKRPFRYVVNSALRLGLEKVEKPIKTKAYATRPHPMGLRQGYDIDNIQELLERIEEDDSK